MKLDLGCGQTPKDGFLGVDIVDGPNVAFRTDLFTAPWNVWRYELAADLNQGDTPDDPAIFNSSFADELFSSHLVEHVPDLVAFMHEAYRVLKPGGRFTIQHPYQHSNRAWQDPTHVRALNEVSWSYYDAQWRRSINIDHYEGFTCDFEVVRIQKILAPDLEKSLNYNRRKIEDAIKHWVNVVDDLIVVLRSRKSG